MRAPVLVLIATVLCRREEEEHFLYVGEVLDTRHAASGSEC